MTTSWAKNDLSLPVRLTYQDRTSETVRLVYAGCTETVLKLEDGREILRSQVHSCGISFDFTVGHELLAA